MFSTLLRGAAAWICSGLAMGLAAQAHAGIVLNTTRLIYPASSKEVSLIVHNTGTSDILAQSWLEGSPDSASPDTPPFAVTPPLARMAGDARQLIRVMYSGEGLATDRESVLWLNVQEIPQSASENELQIAIRQRIKVFYRPQGLTEDPLKAAQALQWRVSGGSIEVSNPGPFHVSMIKLDARKNGRVLLQEASRMLGPRQRVQWPLSPATSSGPVDLSFISINDFGAQEPYHVRVSGEQMTQASKAEPHPD
ncbi:fimbrial biogenesis chaperone [Pseudomonas abietaniphila]|uniref:fimbrial biogenesis chaperone n=1 Tax=Pseudomonas abietaniphila TaxID=89065 RepID=UPI0009E57D97|nr:molecular chaperone [Pseudomonas abietaniphila]